MARNYILGGMGATQLQAGKPYFKRIIRINGSKGGTDGTGAGALTRGDGLTCHINGGKIRFDLTNGKSKAWNAGAAHKNGELLMVEFPTTLRSVQIQLEEASVGVRAKIMLTAPEQNVKADGTETLAAPINSDNTGSFIEIKSGETATISSRTKVVFILIQKYAIEGGVSNIFDTAGVLTAAADGAATDVASILVTGVLDHEPTSGGSQASNEPNSKVIPAATPGGAAGPERDLRKIWGKGDGVG
jgi:hypothetical protein